MSYQLQRHIKFDSTDYGPNALQLLVGICGVSEAEWQQADVGVLRALLARKRLWAGLLAELSMEHKSFEKTKLWNEHFQFVAI